jgi:hypothetical protein
LGIRTLDAANAFLREHYIAEFNRRFTVPAAQVVPVSQCLEFGVHTIPSPKLPKLRLEFLPRPQVSRRFRAGMSFNDTPVI